MELEVITPMGSGYQITRPSVVDAYKLTTILCDGIDCVRMRSSSIRVFPYGRVFCACCYQWKCFDVDKPVWAVRDGHGAGELLVDGLICEDCSNSDNISKMDGARLAPLVYEESVWDIKKECRQRTVSKVIKQWRRFVSLQKERREMALMVAMVCNKMIENCNVTPILNSIIRQFNEMHKLTT
jgi:hypothetical protein